MTKMLWRWTGILRRNEPPAAVPPRQPVILVVDDEAPIRQLVIRYLAPGNPSVLEASNGQEAIAAVAQYGKPIDLLITDIRMPVMDGQTLVEALHVHHPTMKVLFISGFSDVLFESRPLLPVWAAYLDKPIQRDALREAISLLLYGTTRPFGGATVHTLRGSRERVGEVA
jgi:two-component system cell cycle sensor histidine kinase/response regulator CckA